VSPILDALKDKGSGDEGQSVSSCLAAADSGRLPMRFIETVIPA
jgi:hypothetical protein